VNNFPLLAALTVCVSLATVENSFEDLREPPLALDGTAEREATAQKLVAAAALRRESRMKPDSILAIGAVLADGTPTPMTDYFPPVN